MCADEAPGFLSNIEGQLQYDDNVYRTAASEVADSAFIVKPTLGWLGLYRAHEFHLVYKGDYASYFDEDNLNYYRHHLSTQAKLDHSSRLKSEFNFAHRRGSEQPNSRDTLYVPGTKVNKWRSELATAKFEYGAKSSRGQLEGQLTYRKYRYTNNQQEFRDYDGLGGTGIFYYRVAPRTRLLLQVDYQDYDYHRYDIYGGNQSGEQQRYLTGATWEATAKTSGVFKIGYRERSYDDRRFGKRDGLSVDLDGTWRPNDFTKISFGASKEDQESAQQGGGGFVETGINIGVERAVTPRTRVAASTRYTQNEFNSFISRSDDEWRFEISVERSLLHWLDVGLIYRYEERQSNLELFDYSANVILGTISTSFER
ncbi:MAG: outer membrane beta-barrel protein [Parahaliea sp.]